MVIQYRYESLYVALGRFKAHFTGTAAAAFPHPKGHRWGLVRDGGALLIYCGPVAGVVDYC